MDLTQVLEATLSPDTQAIQQSQQALEQLAAENLVMKFEEGTYFFYGWELNGLGVCLGTICS